MAQPRKTTKPS